MNIIKRLFRRHKLQRPETASKAERFEIVLSGSGGQGMILAGKILAEAACIYDEKEAVMTQSYGPEARGGASRAEVIISSEPIDYPKVLDMDILLTMTQEALDKYGKLLNPKGLLIVDETFIKNIPSHYENVFKAPFSSLAIKLLEAPIVANVIALGALAAITNVVTRDALIHAVLACVPDKALMLDRISVDIGFKVAQESGFTFKRKAL